jgi:serine/threonine protein kinase
MPDTTQWHPDEQQLAAFDAGELSGDPGKQVEDHLARCVACCLRLEELPLDAFSAKVRALGAHPDGWAALPGPTAATLPAVAAADTLTPEAPRELLHHARYRILGLLGAGGMGAVFKAEHRLMERVVALKVMRQSLLNRPSAVTQFRQEVRVAARLSHPNIVTAYDADQAGDVHFLVMEFVPGSSLDEVLRQRGPLPVAEACDAVRQAALGLQHAYEQGMVHRDIKPHNLLRTPEGRVKILDFGLARFVREITSAADQPTTDTSSGRWALLMGTPDYIAPEQALTPQQADIRADIYSLGCTLYYLLTGRVPFPAGSAEQKVAAHIEKPAPSAKTSRLDLPPGLDEIIERTLAKDPANRYQTPVDLVHALEAFVHPAAVPERQTTPAANARQKGARPWKRPWLAVSIAGTVTTTLALAFGLGFRPEAPVDPPPATPSKMLPVSTEVPPPKIEQAPLVVEPAPRKATLQDQVVAWLKENSRLNPDHVWVKQQGDLACKQLAKGQVFEMSIGGGFLKSGQPTLLVGHLSCT